MDYGPFGFIEKYDPAFAKWVGSGETCCDSRLLLPKARAVSAGSRDRATCLAALEKTRFKPETSFERVPLVPERHPLGSRRSAPETTLRSPRNQPPRAPPAFVFFKKRKKKMNLEKFRGKR